MAHVVEGGGAFMRSKVGITEFRIFIAAVRRVGWSTCRLEVHPDS